MVCLLCDFKILLTVFNQSYNCQTSHYLGRNRLPKPFLILPSLGEANKNPPHPPQNEGAVAQQGRDPLGETPKFNVVNFEWELLLSLVTIKTWWRGIFQRLWKNATKILRDKYLPFRMSCLLTHRSQLISLCVQSWFSTFNWRRSKTTGCWKCFRILCSLEFSSISIHRTLEIKNRWTPQ